MNQNLVTAFFRTNYVNAGKLEKNLFNNLNIKHRIYNTRDVKSLRNFFIYARYFQWFARFFRLMCSALWRRSRHYVHRSVALQNGSILKEPAVSFFFIPSSDGSFLSHLGRGLSSSSAYKFYCVPWDPLMFFYSYRKIKDAAYEFSPVFIIEPRLLSDKVFRDNFMAIFIRHPVFFASDFEHSLVFENVHKVLFLKRVYPLFITGGQSFYMFLFWIRFVFKFL